MKSFFFVLKYNKWNLSVEHKQLISCHNEFQKTHTFESFFLRIFNESNLIKFRISKVIKHKNFFWIFKNIFCTIIARIFQNIHLLKPCTMSFVDIPDVLNFISHRCLTTNCLVEYYHTLKYCYYYFCIFATLPYFFAFYQSHIVLNVVISK